MANANAAVRAQFASDQVRDRISVLDELMPAIPDHELLRVSASVKKEIHRLKRQIEAHEA